MDTLAITSITNVVLASGLFFLAGMMVRTPKARVSAGWYWSGAMVAIATSALLGGIDHGFVEPAGLPRYAIQRPNWIVLGIATICTLLATSRQFFPPRWQRPVLAIGTIQPAVYAVAVLAGGDFLVVLGYAPVLILLLLMSVLGLRRGSGSWQMVVGIVVLLAATAVQALRVDVLSPLDHDGLYHVIAMAGAPFLHLGGQRLKVA